MRHHLVRIDFYMLLIEIENSPMPTIFPNLKCDDERLIDPSEWKFK